MSVVKRRLFPESFTREAVDRVATSGLSAGALARELGLHETVLRRWMMQLSRCLIIDVTEGSSLPHVKC